MMPGRNSLSRGRDLCRNRPRRAQTLLLDITGAALAAYSVHMRLSSTYAGSAFRVRRSSDNTEQDIGFVGFYIDTASLLSFVGAGNGFIRTLYDQSGNTRDLGNATAGQQPQIVSSGAVLTMGPGIPGMSFDGSDDRLSRADAMGLTGSPALTILSTFKLDSANRGPRGMWGIGATTVSNNRIAMYSNALGINPDYGGSFDAISPSLTTGVLDFVTHRHAAGANVDTADVRIDGVQSTRSGGGGSGALNMANTITMLGCSTNTADFQIMQMATIAFFNSSFSDATAVAAEAVMLGLPC